MPSGTVKFFNDKKAFGFITADEGSQEIFLPAASLTASGLSTIVAGQRVSFETQADKKGPKAVEIKLLPGAPAPVAPKPSPVQAAAPRPEKKNTVTLYHDPDSDISEMVLDELHAAGIEPRIIDYIATPPVAADLRKLSLLLRENDQSLVRKYDTLFLELRLDDRFISENEFWAAISEHPTLINGPVLATQTRANLCRNENDVQNFIASIAPQGEAAVAQPKGLSPRLLQLMASSAAPRPVAPPPAPPEDAPAAEKPVDRNGGRTILKTVERPVVLERMEKPIPAPAPVSAAAPSVEAKAKAAPAAKEPEPRKAEKAAKSPAKKAAPLKPKAAAKAPAKKPAAKPVKKAKR